jgi:NAD(P)-dependent dehydrogenase (short-subunit alcohol dehydrogenase family)
MSIEPQDLFSIAGKTAVVTGGSRGVGLMIARGLVEAGATVYIASRNAEVCDKVAAELSGLPGAGHCISLPTDLSTEAGCRTLKAAVADHTDSLDILVNNAGMQGPVSKRGNRESAWREVLALNLQAVYHLTQFFLPMLRRASHDDDPSRVINVGSLTGLRASDLEAYAYISSKAGMHHLTAYLAKHLAPDVTVNAMALGPFQSKMTENVLKLVGSVVIDHTPLKRIGRPDDVAGTTIFLASKAGAYLTGAVIPVDGGLSRAT